MSSPVVPTVAPALAVARGLVLTVVVGLVGALAHTSGGGLLPGTGAMLVLVAMLLGPCVLLATGRRGWRSLVVATVGGQGVVHAFLSLTAGHAPVPGMPADDGGSLAHLVDHVAMQPGMAAAHAVAAAVVGVLLARGEAALWSLVDLGEALLRRLVRPLLLVLLPAATPRPARLLAALVRVPRAPLPTRGHPARRGPPVALAA